MDFTKPDYKKNNMINLMSSISKNFNSEHEYNELKNLSSEDLKKHKNIALIVVDGLGYNYLSSKKNSFLYKNLKQKMTTVFPSTTACANTSFFLGYPPAQHGLTGWDVYLKEVGSIVSVLPFTPKFGGVTLNDVSFKIQDIMPLEPYTKNFEAENYLFIDREISSGEFTNHAAKFSQVVPAKNYKNALKKFSKKAKKKSDKRKFLHIYIHEFDGCAHEYGVKSKETNELFWKIDKQIEKTYNKLIGTGTKVIVVSDHGHIDTPRNKIIFSDKIKGLDECLSQPLSGDVRVAYAYVKKGFEKKFERIVKKELKNKCWLYKSEDIIKNKLYGLGKHTFKIYDRVGDYTIIMKENYSIKPVLANTDTKKKQFIGHHSGVSDDEMLIPLIHFDC